MMRKNIIKSSLVSLLLLAGCAIDNPFGRLSFEPSPKNAVSYYQKSLDHAKEKRENIRQIREEIRDKYGIDVKFGNNVRNIDSPRSESLDESEEILKTIKGDLEKIYEPLRRCTKTIYLGRPSVKIYYLGTDVSPTGAVFFKYPQEIVINPEYYNLPSLAHEMTHIKANPKNFGFHRRWNEAVGISNLAFSNGEDYELPKNGFIKGYGRAGPWLFDCPTREIIPAWMEDEATFVESIYEPDCWRFRKANPKDLRYRMKLAVLREYDFVSQEQFEMANKVLGDDFKEEVKKTQPVPHK